MKVLLTGATGYIGSHIRDALLQRGHEVVAVVRSHSNALKVAAYGAQPVLGDPTDRGWLVPNLENVDAAIHAASPNDRGSAQFDLAVGENMIEAFSGTAKPYLHTGGLWVWGSGQEISEDSVLNPPRIVAWRTPIERMLLDSDVVVTIPAPGTVYGANRGLTRLITRPDSDGLIRLVGDGSQHWSVIHVADLARLYVVLLERQEPLGYVIAASGESPTVRDIGCAAAIGRRVAAEPLDESRTRIGASLADALALDQRARAAKARGLGWAPTEIGLLEMLSRRE